MPIPRTRAALACTFITLAACGGSEPGSDAADDVRHLARAPALDPLPDTAQPPPPPTVDSLRLDEAAPVPAADTAAVAARDTGAAPPDAGTMVPYTSGAWTVGVVAAGAVRQGTATLTGVRMGRHEDFDRIVLEFADGPLPRYHLEYVDRPVRQCGSGNPIELPGDGWLGIRLEDARGHDDAGSATVDHGTREAGLPSVLRLVFSCDYEAVVEVVAAVRSPRPFRAVELDGPARLVVDVRH